MAVRKFFERILIDLSIFHILKVFFFLSNPSKYILFNVLCDRSDIN